MAARRTFSGSGRNSARGYAPAAASLRGRALALLARRDYTTHELRTKLIDRGDDEAAIAGLVDSLTDAGLLDDLRVAGAHVRTASRVKARGRLRIARELAARGLSKAVIDEALAAVEGADETAAIRKILLRKKWPARPSLADRRRMFAHLFRRGFPGDAIRRALGGDIDVDE